MPSRPKPRLAAVLAPILLAAAACAPSSPGARIFATGEGHAGAIARATAARPPGTSGPPCAGCHGGRGEGGRLGPSITRAVLGSERRITHKESPEDPNPQPVTEGPWTPAQTVETVRTGRTPEGHFLGGIMPRWRLDAQDGDALASYLGTL